MDKPRKGAFITLKVNARFRAPVSGSRWLKGINHSSGNPSDDPGQDGINGTTPQDAFSMVLNYHDGDFNRSGSPFNTNGSNSLYVPGSPSLYNGNISSWQQHMKRLNRMLRNMNRCIFHNRPIENDRVYGCTELS